MSEYSQKLNEAITYAHEKHSGQVRKGTETPYITHPLEVLDIVRTITGDEDVLCAAVLHDVMEDADATYRDIEVRFGKAVADYVAAESENKRVDLPAADTWRLRKEEALAHLRTACREVRIIALGDKLSNIRAIQADYSKIGDALWLRFNCTDKNQHRWYYSSIRDILSPLSDSEAWGEYDELVRRVFENEGVAHTL